MRVVHVDPAPTWRGGERQVLLLASQLAARGIGGVVVAAPGSPLARRAAAADLEVHEIPVAGDLDPRAIARIRSLLGWLRPDLVHLHTARAHGAGGIAARLAGSRPVVVTRRLELPVRGLSGRWKYRHLADHYIAISGAVEAALLAGGVEPDRISLIPSGLPVPLPAITRRAVMTDGVRVGTLAAFTPQKDPDAWVEAVRRAATGDPTLRFVWAGEGELRARAEVAVREAGLADRVEFPGFLENPEEFWTRIDIFFLPSAFEALGTVLLDAMARGLPIVATPVGGIPEVVRDGKEGLLASTPADLAERVLSIARDPALGAQLGDAGRKRAEEYRMDHLAERVAALYGRLTGRDA